MCHCTITYKCGHDEKGVKPYHCKCDTIALEAKKYTRMCDGCVIDVPYRASPRDEGAVFKNESMREMRVRLAQEKVLVEEEDCKEGSLGGDIGMKGGNQEDKEGKYGGNSG